jgi:hypothetical protein
MSQRPRINDYALNSAPVLLDAVNQFSFDVGLEISDFDTQSFRPVANVTVDFIQGLTTVYLWDTAA